MGVTPVVKGLLTYLPGVRHAFARQKTGGTDSARYCYGVWLKHLTLLWASGMRAMPETLAELGPGDSLGVGIAALLSGVRHYFALDVVRYGRAESNLVILDELVELLQTRSGRPVKGWPDFDPHLDASLFPSHILTEEVLAQTLAPERIATIRRLLLEPGTAADISIRYLVPWTDAKVALPETVDLILSHSVLEHVTNLADTYQRCAALLKPKGWMTHQVDLTAHGLSPEWNGYWAYPGWLWLLILGKRPFLINRQPCSIHVALIEQNGFRIITQFHRVDSDGLRRGQLTSEWQGLSESDLVCSGLFAQAQKQEGSTS